MIKNIFLLLTLCLATTYTCVAAESSRKKVKVLTIQSPPLQHITEDGNGEGLDLEILKEIAKIEKWDLSFIPVTLSEGYLKIKTDKRVSEALVFISSKSPEKKGLLNYSKESIIDFFPVIIMNKENNINNYEDLNNKEIAVTQGSEAFNIFETFAREKKITYKAVEIPSITDTIKYVNDNKDAFAVTSDKLFLAENKKNPETKVAFFLSDNFSIHYSTRINMDQDILSTIDKYLALWKKSKTSPYYIFYNKYLKKLEESHQVPHDDYIRPIHYIAAGIILFVLILWIVFLRHKIRKNTQKIQAKEEDIKLTLMNIDDGVIITNNKGEIELINTVAEQLIGYTQHQSQGEHITRILKIEGIESSEELISPIEKMLSSNSTIKNSGTSTLISKGGKKSVITYNTSPIIIDNSLHGVILVLQDITLETNQRRKLTQSEKELKLILSSINEGILFLNKELKIIRYNDKIRKLLSISPELSIEGKNCADICFNDNYSKSNCPAKKALHENKTVSTIIEKANNDVLLVSASPVTDHNNTIVGIIETFLDITDLRKKEEELQASEEKYRVLVENQTDLILRLSPEGILLFASPTFCDLFGRNKEDILNKSYLNINTNNQTVFDKTLNDLRISPHKTYLEVEHDTKKGKRWIAWNNTGVINKAGELDYVIAVGRDITDLRTADEKLKQVQKMEAIGQLAGGIAHDFNNMLGGIVGFAELISMQKSSSENINNFCNQIIKTSERAADLTQQLLSFARKGKAVSSKINAHVAIKSAVTILRRSVNKNIDIQLKLNAENVMIVGDPAQIQSIILNLGINARDAMNDMDGCFTIETSTTTLSKSYCHASNFDISPGEYLQIKATDTGEGMTKETMDHIFEPFFTTKEVGKGTGLGLASIFGTVTLHHGAITAYSEPNSGTEFHIFLPLATATVYDVDSKKEEESVMTNTATEKGTILVIDDEEIIRVLAKSLLEDMGYSVLLAQNGAEGIETYKKHRHEISLVILDVIMPKLSGKETLKRLKEIDQKVKVIVSSGFAQSDKMDDFLDIGAQTFIKKPYRQKDLFKIINEVLQ